MGFLFFIFGLALIFGGLWLVLNALSVEDIEMCEEEMPEDGWEEEIWEEAEDLLTNPIYSSLVGNAHFEDKTEWFEDPSYMDISGNIYHSPCEDEY